MKIAVPDSAVEAILPAVADFLSAPKMVVGGQSCEALSGKTFAVYDPATGGEIAQVPAERDDFASHRGTILGRIHPLYGGLGDQDLWPDL